MSAVQRQTADRQRKGVDGHNRPTDGDKAGQPSALARPVPGNDPQQDVKD
ncbi:hypothetical protein GCM10007860_02190 [Chitiniphilus shinanonensis]|uniref:Uncharacterized protein n=1 Tax=Chitiniphilus shinanonensis TaxID=553088 RepID=A0ABQ6BP64_9NEIS|nr:hypothetical protein [Chitiniphilus shinanonensis]GLS03076.1 hypothetical protein GCM10007860_02190 [Chitiniphilus shinanonensis]